MKRRITILVFLTLFAYCGRIVAQQKISRRAAMPPANFESKVASVNGVKIHYVIGGKGEALILLHGFGQNWYMWNRLLPELSKHFTVIAADLRGVGESDKPGTGYDKKTMAIDIHELVKKLGFSKVNIAGHDIGFMVAYAYAAEFPGDVERLALMDALIPGLEPIWTPYKGQAWWWGFSTWPTAPMLVKGREAIFLTNFWPVVGYKNNSFTSAESKEFIRAYSVPGAISGSFGWFAAFDQDIKDMETFEKTKLQMPVLAMGGDHSTAGFLADQLRLVAVKVTESKITDAGHWLVQEQTAQVLSGLMAFFTAAP
jgi:pimeloyl-ACP methyl ester carboxylesterase